eukprot:6124145-Pleurochrysis_carterae.AAC.3
MLHECTRAKSSVTRPPQQHVECPKPTRARPSNARMTRVTRRRAAVQTVACASRTRTKHRAALQAQM